MCSREARTVMKGCQTQRSSSGQESAQYRATGTHYPMKRNTYSSRNLSSIEAPPPWSSSSFADESSAVLLLDQAFADVQCMPFPMPQHDDDRQLTAILPVVSALSKYGTASVIQWKGECILLSSIMTSVFQWRSLCLTGGLSQQQDPMLAHAICYDDARWTNAGS